jgi:ABC-2 type transport system permease protein
MNSFLTQVRRDLADNRGALVFTPLIISAVIVLLVIFGSLTGRDQFGFGPAGKSHMGTATSVYQDEKGHLVIRKNAKGEVSIRTGDGERQRFEGVFSHTVETSRGPVTVARGADGRVMVTTPEGTKELGGSNNNTKIDIADGNETLSVTTDASGKTTVKDQEGKVAFDGNLTPTDTKKVEQILAYATAVIAAVPVGIAGIVVLFLLAGSLFEERKDRSILFWKSMPVSDLSTVGAKFVAIIGVGLGFSAAISILLHLIVMAIAAATMASFGITGVSMTAVLGTAFGLWMVGAVALLIYVAWVLPVYSWIVLASAWAPKSPFILAFVPIAALPLLAGLFRFDLDIAGAPLARLIGYPVVEQLKGIRIDNAEDVIVQFPVNDIIAAIFSNLGQPTFWVGLALSGMMIWGASEIRRRRAF